MGVRLKNLSNKFQAQQSLSVEHSDFNQSQRRPKAFALLASPIIERSESLKRKRKVGLNRLEVLLSLKFQRRTKMKVSQLAPVARRTAIKMKGRTRLQSI